LPTNVLQSNWRVAESQLICDGYGKPVRTTIATTEEADAEKNKKNNLPSKSLKTTRIKLLVLR